MRVLIGSNNEVGKMEKTPKSETEDESKDLVGTTEGDKRLGDYFGGIAGYLNQAIATHPGNYIGCGFSAPGAGRES